MNHIPSNHRRLLEAVQTVRLADLETLTALCGEPRKNSGYSFGEWGVKRAVQRLTASGHLKRIPIYRDPEWPSGRRRYIYHLGTPALTLLACDRAERARLERRMAKIMSSEWRVYHDLFVSKLHAALIVLQRARPDVFKLELFERGEKTEIKQQYTTPSGKTFTLQIQPDARFSVLNPQANRRWNFLLEADTGTERQESDDRSRYTIAKKVKRYCIADREDMAKAQFGIAGLHVLFLTPRRYVEGELRPREKHMMETVKRRAGEHWEMFRFLSLSDVDFKNPAHLLDPVVYDAEARQFPLIGGTRVD